MTKIEAKQYRIGDALITSGESICFIVGQTETAGVFLVAGDQIRWEYYADHVVPHVATRALSRYEALWYELGRSTGKQLRRPLILQIANALFSGLQAESNEAVDEAFRIVDESVHYNAKANQAFRYLLGSIVAVVVVGVVELGFVYLFGLTPASRTILLAAFTGGIGAVLSVLQRLGTLEINAFAPLWYACLQGIARAVLGVLFGVWRTRPIWSSGRSPTISMPSRYSEPSRASASDSFPR